MALTMLCISSGVGPVGVWIGVLIVASLTVPWIIPTIMKVLNEDYKVVLDALVVPEVQQG